MSARVHGRLVWPHAPSQDAPYYPGVGIHTITSSPSGLTITLTDGTY